MQPERLGRQAGVDAAEALAYLALAELDADPSSEYRQLARALQEECGLLGLSGAAPTRAREPVAAAAEPTYALRCLGGLWLGVEAVSRTLVRSRLAPGASCGCSRSTRVAPSIARC